MERDVVLNSTDSHVINKDYFDDDWWKESVGMGESEHGIFIYQSGRELTQIYTNQI
jgi:hypothetical protein